jgi:hypothetical protein
MEFTIGTAIVTAGDQQRRDLELDVRLALDVFEGLKNRLKLGRAEVAIETVGESLLVDIGHIHHREELFPYLLRMKLAPGSMALGLDQIPESFLPAIAAHSILPVSALDAAIVSGFFFAGELAVSRALFALNIRDRPY